MKYFTKIFISIVETLKKKAVEIKTNVVGVEISGTWDGNMQKDCTINGWEERAHDKYSNVFAFPLNHFSILFIIVWSKQIHLIFCALLTLFY